MAWFFLKGRIFYVRVKNPEEVKGDQINEKYRKYDKQRLMVTLELVTSILNWQNSGEDFKSGLKGPHGLSPNSLERTRTSPCETVSS